MKTNFVKIVNWGLQIQLTSLPKVENMHKWHPRIRLPVNFDSKGTPRHVILKKENYQDYFQFPLFKGAYNYQPTDNNLVN